MSSIINYPVGSLLDFRVEAFIGYWVPPTSGDHMMGMHSSKIERDESSSFSSVQTVTLTSGSLSSSLPSQTAVVSLPSVTFEGNQTQSPNPLQPFDIFSNPLFTFSVGVLFSCIVIVVVLGVFRRHIKTPTYTNDTS